MADLLDLIARSDPFAGRGAGTGLRYVLLDVFAERPLEGNQLAVFTGAPGLAAAEMQGIARELRLSESVFVLAPEAGGDVRVRIFTPETEMPFAGHPVLGTGALLAVTLQREEVVLETGAGAVAVELRESGGAVLAASMRQPIPTWEPFVTHEPLLTALGLDSSELPVERYRNGASHIFVAAPSPEAVASLSPDLHAVQELAPASGVSCFAGAAGRFKTRMFAPGLGVAEDPATGSAAGPLAVHLIRHGRAAHGERLEISQGAELGRPSLLIASAEGEGERFEVVEVGGGVVIVGQGELRPR